MCKHVTVQDTLLCFKSMMERFHLTVALTDQNIVDKYSSCVIRLCMSCRRGRTMKEYPGPVTSIFDRNEKGCRMVATARPWTSCMTFSSRRLKAFPLITNQGWLVGSCVISKSSPDQEARSFRRSWIS